MPSFPHFFAQEKEKRETKEKTKSFKAEAIKGLSPKSKCYCFSHSRAHRIQKFFFSANHDGWQNFWVFHGPSTLKSISLALILDLYEWCKFWYSCRETSLVKTSSYLSCYFRVYSCKFFKNKLHHRIFSAWILWMIVLIKNLQTILSFILTNFCYRFPKKVARLQPTGCNKDADAVNFEMSVPRFPSGWNELSEKDFFSA